MNDKWFLSKEYIILYIIFGVIALGAVIFIIASRPPVLISPHYEVEGPNPDFAEYFYIIPPQEDTYLLTPRTYRHYPDPITPEEAMEHWIDMDDEVFEYLEEEFRRTLERAAREGY